MTARPGTIYRPRVFWTDAERAFIVETHGSLTAKEQAQALKRDYDCLCYQRERLMQAGHLPPSQRKYARVFTDEDRERIVELTQAGYSVWRIARALKRSHGAIVHEIAAMGGIKHLRSQEPSARVRVPAEVGILFSRTKHTVHKWVRLGWLASHRNARHSRVLHTCRLITDDMIQLFLAKRDYWPAWDVIEITDPDWQSYARDVRAQAGGDWVAMQTAARQTGLRVTQLYAWFRAGKLTCWRTLRYGQGKGHECFLWSADIDAMAAAMRADPRTGQRRTNLKQKEYSDE
jgi:hypothetical protein